MDRQREGTAEADDQGARPPGQPPPSPVVRLTDQALVAVTLARTRGGPAPPTLVDLVVGLAAEPEGAAGHLLRSRSSAAAALQSAPGDTGAADAAASLDAAVARAARAASPRPAATLDLLGAAVELGGGQLAVALEAAGFDTDELRVPTDRDRPWDLDWVAHAETYGFDPHGDPELSPPVARAVAQVRAVRGGAVDLLLALSSSPDVDLGGRLPTHDRLSAAAWRLRKRGRPADVGPEDWDADVDAVMDAARAWRSGTVVTPLDVVRAAVLSGGVAPAALVDEADRP